MSPSAAWASLPGLDPHVMGAPLPEADYLPQNNSVSSPVREVGSGTDATMDGRRVGAAPLPVSVSTSHSGNALVGASKRHVPQLKRVKAAIDLKLPKLSVGKLRESRQRGYSSKDPAGDQFSLTIAEAPVNLTIADAPVPRSQSAEPGRVGMFVLMLSMSAWVFLVAALVVLALMRRLSV